MKLSPTQVKKAIIQEAFNIKRKKEIYKKAKELNKEVKKLNEMHAFENGLGPGFKNSSAPGTPGASGAPAQVLGLAIGPMVSGKEDTEDINKVGNFEDLYKLDKEMSDLDNETNNDIADLEKENAQLKEKLARLAKLAQTLNENEELDEEKIDELFGGLKGVGNFAKNKIQGAGRAIANGVSQAKQAYVAGEEKAARNKAQAQISNIAKQIRATQNQLNQLNQQYANLTNGKTYSGKAVHSPAE